MSNFKETMQTLFSTRLMQAVAVFAILVALAFIAGSWHVAPLLGVLVMLVIGIIYGAFLLLMHLLLK